MAYTPLDITKPVVSPGSRLSQIDQTRANFAALRDLLVLTGNVPGFNSVKYIGTGSSSQPQARYFKNGSTWIRADLTWGTTGVSDGNLIKTACWISFDAGASWSPMADPDGNYVVTIAYDAEGNPDTTTWGTTP